LSVKPLGAAVIVWKTAFQCQENRFGHSRLWEGTGRLLGRDARRAGFCGYATSKVVGAGGEGLGGPRPFGAGPLLQGGRSGGEGGMLGRHCGVGPGGEGTGSGVRPRGPAASLGPRPRTQKKIIGVAVWEKITRLKCASGDVES